MEATEIEVRVADGVLTGLDFGGRGQAVLLVHGSGHNAAVWSDVATRLVDHCHPVALDLRGHGQNRLDSEDPEQYWRDLGDALESWSWHRPVLVGHSTGGYAAAALTASGLVTPAALCVVDGFVLDDRATAVNQHAALRSAETAEQLSHTFRYGWSADDAQMLDYVERSVRGAASDWLNAGARPELVEQVARRSFLRVGSRWVRRPTMNEIVAVSSVQPAAEILPARDLYDQIGCPLALVLATDGFYASRQAEVEAVVEARTDRRLIVIDSNHNVPMTRPDELAPVILDLVLAQAPGPTKPGRE